MQLKVYVLEPAGPGPSCVFPAVLRLPPRVRRHAGHIIIWRPAPAPAKRSGDEKWNGSIHDLALRTEVGGPMAKKIGHPEDDAWE